MTQRFDVSVVREGRWWILTVPALDLVTRSRRLDQAEAMAIEAIALDLDVAESAVSVDLDVRLPAEVEAEWAESRRIEALAREAAKRAAALARSSVRELRGLGMTQREIARLLEISPQRVGQLERSLPAG